MCVGVHFAGDTMTRLGTRWGGACGAGKCQIATPTRAVVAHADPFLSLFLIAQMAGYLGSTWTWRVVP